MQLRRVDLDQAGQVVISTSLPRGRPEKVTEARSEGLFHARRSLRTRHAAAVAIPKRKMHHKASLTQTGVSGQEKQGWLILRV